MGQSLQITHLAFQIANWGEVYCNKINGMGKMPKRAKFGESIVQILFILSHIDSLCALNVCGERCPSLDAKLQMRNFREVELAEKYSKRNR